VENTLMESQFHDVARAYITYRSERDRIRLLRQAAPDKDAISEYTTVAKYARYDEDMGRREVYEEICGRVERMHVNKFPEYAAEIHNAFNLVRSKDLLPSMRSFQFAGPAIEKN